MNVVGKVMSLLFSMLPRFAIAFLPRREHLLISWLQSLSTVILEPKKIKPVIVSTFPPLFAIKWWDQILVFWMLSFKPGFSFSSFTLIECLFSSSSLSAIRVVSSAYLRLLIFLLAILTPVCASSSPVFHMMYSSYQLNKQPCDTPLPILIQSIVPCPVLTVALWLAYRFLRRQVRWSGTLGLMDLVPKSHLFGNFPQFVVIHTVKIFSIVNGAEVYVFLELTNFFYDPTDVGNLMSAFSAFLNPTWTSGSSQFTYC